jgi:hypothetical protein
MEKDFQSGTIVRLDNYGLAIVKTKETGDVYPFTFDKVLHYRGQSAREIGLRLGAHVRFLADDGKIRKVEILPSFNGELARSS